MCQTGCDHERNEAVTEAALWLAAEATVPSPVVPTLRTRFGLTAVEACRAAAEASKMRGAARGKAA